MIRIMRLRPTSIAIPALDSGIVDIRILLEPNPPLHEVGVKEVARTAFANVVGTRKIATVQ